MLAVKELSEEEKQQVMMTEDYQRFLDRSSRVMERALTQDIDIFVDYTGEHQEGERYVSLLSLMSASTHGDLVQLQNVCLWISSDHSFGEKLKLQRVFFDEHWSKHRLVTCMDWSKQVNSNL